MLSDYCDFLLDTIQFLSYAQEIYFIKVHRPALLIMQTFLLHTSTDAHTGCLQKNATL